MSYVIRLKNTGEYLARKGMTNRWVNDIGKARLFGRVQDTVWTIRDGDASFESYGYNYNRAMVHSRKLTLPIELEVVEAIMSPGEIMDTLTPKFT